MPPPSTNPKSARSPVIVSAPWIPAAEIQSLSTDFPEVHFGINCHSNVGFLQADRNGVKLMREGRTDETLIEMIRANVRTPDQTVGDIWAP